MQWLQCSLLLHKKKLLEMRFKSLNDWPPFPWQWSSTLLLSEFASCNELIDLHNSNITVKKRQNAIVHFVMKKCTNVKERKRMIGCLSCFGWEPNPLSSRDILTCQLMGYMACNVFCEKRVWLKILGEIMLFFFHKIAFIRLDNKTHLLQAEDKSIEWHS